MGGCLVVSFFLSSFPFFFSLWRLCSLLLFVNQKLEPSLNTVPLAGHLERTPTGWLNFLNPFPGRLHALCSQLWTVYLRICPNRRKQRPAVVLQDAFSLCIFHAVPPRFLSVSQQSIPSWRIWYCWNTEVEVRHPLLSSTFCTCLKAGLAARAAWKVIVDWKPLLSENERVQEPQLASRMDLKEPPLLCYFMKQASSHKEIL